MTRTCLDPGENLVRAWQEPGKNLVRAWQEPSENLVRVWWEPGETLVRLWQDFAQTLARKWWETCKNLHAEIQVRTWQEPGESWWEPGENLARVWWKSDKIWGLEKFNTVWLVIFPSLVSLLLKWNCFLALVRNQKWNFTFCYFQCFSSKRCTRTGLNFLKTCFTVYSYLEKEKDIWHQLMFPGKQAFVYKIIDVI